MCNSEKETLTAACIEPPPYSYQEIPSKFLERRMRKIDSSVSTKRNVRDNVGGNFNDIPNGSKVFSKCSMGGHQANVSTHLEHEGTIFYGGNGHYHQTFKHNNNAHVLYVSNNDSKDISECHFKC